MIPILLSPLLSLFYEVIDPVWVERVGKNQKNVLSEIHIKERVPKVEGVIMRSRFKKSGG